MLGRPGAALLAVGRLPCGACLIDSQLAVYIRRLNRRLLAINQITAFEARPERRRPERREASAWWSVAGCGRWVGKN